MKYRIIQKLDGNDTEYYVIQYNDFLPLPTWFTLKRYRRGYSGATEDIRFYDYRDALDRVNEGIEERNRGKTKDKKIVYDSRTKSKGHGDYEGKCR